MRWLKPKTGKSGSIFKKTTLLMWSSPICLCRSKRGIETITQLKENLKENFQNLKIIAISGGARANGVDHLKAAVDLGADKVLAKPFTSAELLFNVDACLQSMSLDD